MTKRILHACVFAAGLSACSASNTNLAQHPAEPVDAGVADAGPSDAGSDDAYLWLEDVTGDKSIAWVKQQNVKSTTELQGDPRFNPLNARLRSILDSKDKLPPLSKQGKWFYNFWQDETHPKGIWRRVPSFAEYKKPNPKWETVLDVDALAAADQQPWVYKGSDCLKPKFERCLIQLSRGGADAVVFREFDTVKKAFVNEKPFELPEAKSEMTWRDLDTVFIGTDYGPGTLTSSGYPRQVKLWKRGTPLAQATLIFEGQTSDVDANGNRSFDHGRNRDFVTRNPTFFSSQVSVLVGDKPVRIEAPESALLSDWDDQLILQLRDDWAVNGTTYKKGSLLAAPFDAFLKGGRELTVLFEPTPHSAMLDLQSLKSGLIVNTLEDVHNVVFFWSHQKGKWAKTALPLKGLGSIEVKAVEPGETDQYFVLSNGYLEPATLSLAAIGKPTEQLKQAPAFFDAKNLAVEQHFATSKDGTKVPYFQVAPKDLTLDGTHPTLLTGYGGFEISETPIYNPLVGAGWLEKGGVFVQANIRGGGEYGPGWHQAALKHDRQRAYDDFIAIGEDLIARKVTSTPKLGIIGGSNGGLLMGVMLTQRPDLFGAIVCMAPLLDMKRYSQLLAGASWMGEYGDPNVPEDWAAIAKYSPYQNAKKGVAYPRTLFTTSTRDDRVHPGHARKMFAKLSEQGHDALFYENVEGGHAGAANAEEVAFMRSLAYVFLYRQLGLAEGATEPPGKSADPKKVQGK